MKSRKRSLLSRFVAGATALIFFLQNAPLAQAAEASLWDQRRGALKRNADEAKPTMMAALPMGLGAAPNQLLDRLPSVRPSGPMAPRAGGERTVPASLETVVAAIPLTYGSIKKTDVVPGALGTVVLLQDVHLNAEAQANLGQIMQALIDAGQTGLVGVEGAFSSFDFKWYREHGDRSILLALSDDFLKRNLIAAPSYVGLTSAAPLPPFLGVDDPDGYRANVNAYLASNTARAAVKTELNRATAMLTALKRTTFSPALSSFDALAAGYHDGSLEMGTFIERLATFEPALPPSLKRFSDARIIERDLDFNRVERERRTVVRRLAESLSEVELRDLLALSLAQRTGQVGFADFYDGLEKMCRRKSISLSSAPTFEAYLRYVKLADGIDGETLFGDLARVEDALYARLSPSPAAAAISAADRRLRLFSRLAGFAFTPEEWKRFDETRAGWEDALARLPMTAGDRARLAALAPRLRPFENFYREADRRSRSIVDHLLAGKTANPGAARVLVLGGFHAPMVAALLREKKMSTIVVQPKLTAVAAGSGTEYLSVFERDNTPLDRLFNGAKLSVAPDVVALGALSARTAPVDRVFRVSLAVEELAHAGRKLDADLGIETTANGDGTLSFRAPVVGGTYSGVHGAAGQLFHVGQVTFSQGASGPLATWGLTGWFTRRILNPLIVPLLNRLGLSATPVADHEISTRVAPRFETAVVGAIFAGAFVTLTLGAVPGLVALPAIAAAGVAYTLSNVAFALLHIRSLRTAQGPPASKALAFGRLFLAGLVFHAPLLLAGPAVLITNPVLFAGVLVVTASFAYGWGRDTHAFYNAALLGRAGPQWLTALLKTWPVATADTGLSATGLPLERDPLTGAMLTDVQIYEKYPFLAMTDPTVRSMAWLVDGRQHITDIAQVRSGYKSTMDAFTFKDGDDRATRQQKIRDLRAYAERTLADANGLQALSAGRTTMLVNALRDAEEFLLASQIYERTPHPEFRRSDMNTETYLWNMARLSERQTGAERAQTIVRAGDYAGNFQADKKPGEPLSGEFRARQATIYRLKHEAAEQFRRARTADTRPANYDDLEQNYRLIFPADEDLSGVADNSAIQLLLAHGEYMLGYRVDYSYFPGINALSTAQTITDLLADPKLDAYAREVLVHANPQQLIAELSPLVYQSIRVAGGEQSNNYWVVATLLEFTAMEGLEGSAKRMRNFLSLAMRASRKAQDVLSTAGRIEAILARRERNAATRNDETTQAIRETLAVMRERAAALRKDGDDATAPVALEPAIRAQDPRIDRELQATRDILQRMFDFRGIDSSYVGGNVDYGGQTHNTSVSRPDIRLATEILQKLNLYGEIDFEKFDADANRFIGILINLVNPETGERWLEDLHGDRHNVFDPLVVALREFSSAKVSKQSQTNVMADAALCLGDCRQAAHVKQLLYEAWKKSNVTVAMDQSWHLLQREQISEPNQVRFQSRMQRVRTETDRLRGARAKIESGAAMTESEWKDVSQRLVDRVQRNQLSNGRLERIRELVYALETGAPLSAQDRADLNLYVDAELGALSDIYYAYARLLTQHNGNTALLTPEESALLQQDVVRQINTVMNWQLAVLDVTVMGNVDMEKMYDERKIVSGKEDGTGRDLTGKSIYSPQSNAIENHTLNGLYRLRKTFVRDASGALVQVKVMDRFSLRDSFYQEVYPWANQRVDDLTTVLGPANAAATAPGTAAKKPDAVISGGMKSDPVYELVREEGGVPIYRERRIPITLLFTRHAGAQSMRLGESRDENGQQNRIWGLLARELNFDMLVSSDRRVRVWRMLRWVRDLMEIQDAAPLPDTAALLAEARARLVGISAMLARNAPQGEMDAEIRRVQALAQSVRTLAGKPATPVDDLVAQFDSPKTSAAPTATWGLTRLFTRVVLNRWIIPLINRVGLSAAPIRESDVSTRVAPWFETVVTGLVFTTIFAALALGWIPGVNNLSPLVSSAIAYVSSNIVFAALHANGLQTAQGPPQSTSGALARLFVAGSIFHLPMFFIGIAAFSATPAIAFTGVIGGAIFSFIWGTGAHEAYNLAVLAKPGTSRFDAALRGWPIANWNGARPHSEEPASSPGGAATFLQSVTPTGAVPAALRALGLGSARTVGEPRVVNAQFFDVALFESQTFKLDVVTVEPANEGDLALLRAESGQDVERFELVFHEGRLLAIVPALTPWDRATLAQVNAVRSVPDAAAISRRISANLRARHLHYIDLVGLGDAPARPTDAGAAQAWGQALRQRENDRHALDGYFRAIGFNSQAIPGHNELISSTDPGKEPQVVVRINLRDNSMTATEVSAATIKDLTADRTADPDVVEEVLNILPTVYSPGKAANFNDDRDYYSSILRGPAELERLTGGKWQGKKRILLVGAGSGLDTLSSLLAALRRAGENDRGRGYTLDELRSYIASNRAIPTWAPDMTARDINPMAVANTRELFERLGIGAVLDIEVGSNLPERPSAKFDLVIWNMPVYPAGAVEESLAGRGLTTFQDGGLNGKIALEVLAQRLPANLADGGISILWNYGRFTPEGTDIVASTIEADPAARDRGITVSGGGTAGPVTYFVTVKKRSGDASSTRTLSAPGAMTRLRNSVSSLVSFLAAIPRLARKLFQRQNTDTDAEKTARRLVEIFRDGRITPAEATEAVLSLVAVEKLTQRPDRGIVGASALSAALSAELGSAWQGGKLDADAARRIADLVFQLRFNGAGAAAVSAAPVPLSALPVATAENVLFASWISSEQMGRSFVRELMSAETGTAQGRTMVLGLNEKNAAKILAALRTDPAIRALESAGRLMFVVRDDSATVLTLLEAASRIPALVGQARPQIQFLLPEGAELPPGFFNLTEAQWANLRSNFIVHFITQSLQAIPMDASLLVDYQAFRLILTQA